MDLHTNLLVLIASAISIWVAGTRLAIYADEIAQRTGIGRAFIGACLLALATSLPEIITSVTASIIDNPSLAINNLLGGIPLQTAILAFADIFIVKGPALTYFSPKPVLILSGLFLIGQIALIIIAYSVGEVFTFWGVGFWPTLFFLIYILMLYTLNHFEKKERWVPLDLPHKRTEKKLPAQLKTKKFSNLKLTLYFLFSSFVVLVAGSAVAYSSDLIVKLADLRSSFIGGTVVALATSLPEVSTTIGALRVHAYTLAFANIFGSNALMVAVFFITDLAYRKGSVIQFLDYISITFASVGILVTTIYLWGILNRRKKTIFAMGLDSFLVLLVYALSVAALYFS